MIHINKVSVVGYVLSEDTEAHHEDGGAGDTVLGNLAVRKDLEQT